MWLRMLQVLVFFRLRDCVSMASIRRSDAAPAVRRPTVVVFGALDSATPLAAASRLYTEHPSALATMEAALVFSLNVVLAISHKPRRSR